MYELRGYRKQEQQRKAKGSLDLRAGSSFVALVCANYREKIEIFQWEFSLLAALIPRIPWHERSKIAFFFFFPVGQNLTSDNGKTAEQNLGLALSPFWRGPFISRLTSNTIFSFGVSRLLLPLS